MSFRKTCRLVTPPLRSARRRGWIRPDTFAKPLYLRMRDSTTVAVVGRCTGLECEPVQPLATGPVIFNPADGLATSCGWLLWRSGRWRRQNRFVAIEAISDFVVASEAARTRWVTVAICAGMTALGVAFIVFGGLLVVVVIGAAVVAFFGALGLPLVVLWAIHPVPLLIISTTGITINRYAISDTGMVGWDDVTTVAVASKGSLSWVRVTVSNPAEFLRRQPRARRMLLRLNGWGRLPVVQVLSTGLQVSASDLAAAVTVRRGRPPDQEISTGP